MFSSSSSSLETLLHKSLKLESASENNLRSQSKSIKSISFFSSLSACPYSKVNSFTSSSNLELKRIRSGPLQQMKQHQVVNSSIYVISEHWVITGKNSSSMSVHWSTCNISIFFDRSSFFVSEVVVQFLYFFYFCISQNRSCKGRVDSNLSANSEFSQLQFYFIIL